MRLHMNPPCLLPPPALLLRTPFTSHFSLTRKPPVEDSFLTPKLVHAGSQEIPTAETASTESKSLSCPPPSTPS